MLAIAWQKLDAFFRQLLPAFTAILFALLSVMALPIPYWGTISPSLIVIAIYYWSVYRPDLFGPTAAFIVGLLCDALSGFPFGLSALLFVGARELLISQRRFFVGHSFFMLWIGFILTILLVTILEWILLALWRWSPSPVLPLIIQTFVTIAIFPLPAWFLILLQRTLLTQD